MLYLGHANICYIFLFCFSFHYNKNLKGCLMGYPPPNSHPVLRNLIYADGSELTVLVLWNHRI